MAFQLLGVVGLVDKLGESVGALLPLDLAVFTIGIWFSFHLGLPFLQIHRIARLVCPGKEFCFPVLLYIALTGQCCVLV